MKVKAIYLLATLFALLLLACADSSTQQTAENQQDPSAVAYQLVSPAVFEGLMETQADAQVLDVRTPEEVAKGHLPGAINYNVMGDSFAEEVRQLDPQRPVLLYCRSGRRSAHAARALQAMGFQQIYELEGGILAWQKASMPVQP